MLVCSPECGSGSRQNYDRELDTQRVALGKVWVALGYVRRALPRVVVVENVCEPCTVGPLGEMLARLEGYGMAAGRLSPVAVDGTPMERDRHFWVLTRITT